MAKTQIERFDNRTLQPKIYPEDARRLAAPLAPNLTNVSEGTVMGQRTSDGALAPYDAGNPDGTETAAGLLEHRVSTDAQGNIYLSDTAVPSSVNPPQGQTAAVFVAGNFDEDDLTGWDAGALADLGARELFNGVIRIP